MQDGKNLIPIGHSNDSITRFLKHIQIVGVPKKVTTEYLRSVGFRSGNDPELRHIFKLLGFLDEAGRPTEKWRDYRKEGQSIETLQKAVKKCYQDLFEELPNAPQLDNKDSSLLKWFRENTSGSKTSVKRAIRTFRVLSWHAEIGLMLEEEPNKFPVSMPSSLQLPASSDYSLPITLNSIAINLPISQDPKVYEHIFEALRKSFYK